MDTKIVLKSSTKLSLNDRFSKIHTRANQQQQQQQQPQPQSSNRRSLSSNNPLSIKRGSIGSKKPVTEARGLRGIRGTLRRGSVASRLMQKPVRTAVQNYVASPVRGGTVRGRGFQRGGRRGGVSRGGGQINIREQGRVGNKPTRGLGKRTQPSGVVKEDLDKDLESYMSKTKGFLDDQLDEYQQQK